MSEARTKALAMLANVMCEPWRVATITEDGNPEPKQILVIDADRDQIASVEVRSDAELFAAAPTIIATLCDEADAAERRSVDADAGAAALREAAQDVIDEAARVTGLGYDTRWLLTKRVPALKSALTNPAGRAIIERIERAEAERDKAVADLKSAYPRLVDERDAACAKADAAELERDALRAERSALRAVVCIGCGGTGSKRPNVGSTILCPPGTHCDKCGGSGAVIVRGDK